MLLPSGTSVTCVTSYGVTDEAERERMMSLAAEGKQQAWWQSYDLAYATYVGLEAEAVSISAFQSSVVHGLLQTADYARAGHEGAMPQAQLPIRSSCKSRRSSPGSASSRGTTPPRSAWSWTKRRCTGWLAAARSWRRNWRKILDVAALPNVTVQVLPYELGAHPAMESNFTILELPDPTPGVVFVEGLIGSTYLERDDDLIRYQKIFRKLASIALGPQELSLI